jgi:hypothetical protein
MRLTIDLNFLCLFVFFVATARGNRTRPTRMLISSLLPHLIHPRAANLKSSTQLRSLYCPAIMLTLRNDLGLARSAAFLFAFLAGGLTIVSAVLWLRSSIHQSRANEAAASWQSSPAKLEKLESFVRQSSFYYRVSISYRWREEERVFSESWIPQDWWSEGTGAASVGDAMTLWIDPASPDRAAWNPQFQVVRYRDRIRKEQSYFWAGLAACIAFSVIGKFLAKKGIVSGLKCAGEAHPSSNQP